MAATSHPYTFSQASARPSVGVQRNRAFQSNKNRHIGAAPHRAAGMGASVGASSAGAPGGSTTGPAVAVREVLSPSNRQKLDLHDDRDFYAQPRLVQHLDAGFRAQLTQLYRRLIPEGAAVLDLCSSWVSHLPPERRYARVVGHGMNAAELGRNPQLSEFFVRDLNRAPTGWALPDGSMDAVVCCASVQYMQQPEAVFAEIWRVLKPGGVAIIAFSNRMFYQKAIAAWRDNSDFGRCQLVRSYFAAVPDGFTAPEVVRRVELPAAGDGSGAAAGPMQKLQQWAERVMGWEAWLGGGSPDPFFAVVAYKTGDAWAAAKDEQAATQQ